METFNPEDALNLYGIDSWGASYFSVKENGHLAVNPNKDPNERIDIVKVVEDLQKSRLKTPILLRFPQILKTQIRSLSESFDVARKEFNYQEGYFPVFPIKVNQNRMVVENLLEAGYTYNLGIEVGSKPELMAALAVSVPDEALTICNGFKDRDYVHTASLGVRMGRKVIVVIEKPFELKTLVDNDDPAAAPWLGIRIKLNAKGSGLWEKSGGVTSKFGLSTSQLLESIDLLQQNKMIDRLKMLHFHIGSQITEIRKLKGAIKEAARIYAKVRKLGIPIEYMDVGGGLGVDYDGSKTSSDASVNYSMQEYANDVVYSIADVCEDEHVPHPKIISESGRSLVAYHSMLVVDVRDQISEKSIKKPKFSGDEHKVIEDLIYIQKNISVKNYREFYHDALEHRDEVYSLFNLGLIDLEDRAKGEWLYWSVAKKAVKFSRSAKFMADEFVDLKDRMFSKFICNFSVFQSIPDHWALDQLFPIVPIQRLNERPTQFGTIVDITCDSDGEVDKFVDLKDIKHALELHELKENEPYYIAFLLIGAYQDIMGDLHNLFGAVNEAHVMTDSSGKFYIKDTRKGDTIAKAVSYYGYDPDKLVKTIKARLQEKVNGGQFDTATAAKLVEEYKKKFNNYPYLD